ncbi:MAG: DDE-type integrase/transposase/recombinase [Acidobacteria bacterium]|nr:DDE-type integrase/transposase/recombinase [Acidobacteriota bacterium]
MSDDSQDHAEARALARYQVISAYLALEPPRGQRLHLLEQLAHRSWVGADGELFQVSAETIRKWVARYRDQGLEGLRDKSHPRRGTLALTPEQIELVCSLRREVPERSLDRIIRIAEDMKLVAPGHLRRSTLHRVLQAHGLSERAARTPDKKDLDRFEADFANDLWQSDMLVGPWLPDPQRPGKSRRAYLYAFLDDHSRLLLHGRFSFKGDLPALELVFRRSLQKFGHVHRVYYDNGQTYRSHHMKHIVATLGIHRIIFTQKRRPEGHGKIEALNRYIRSAFLAELKATHIQTLDELNEAFSAWVDQDYNRRVHSETGQPPRDRWRADIDRVAWEDEEKLRQAFLWKEKRTPDKAGVFSLFGTEYQVGPALARRRIELRYDPERLDLIEVWYKNQFVERVRPFEVQTHRRPKPAPAAVDQAPAVLTKPVADYLGHLVNAQRKEGRIEPSPKALAAAARAERAAADDAVVELLADRLDPAVVDQQVIRDFCERFGPFDVPQCERAIASLLERGLTDQHITIYLDAIRRHHHQGQQP